MFVDHSPVPNVPAKFGARKVIVIEEKDKPYTLFLLHDVIGKARVFEATSRDEAGAEIFWIVFANEPKRLLEMTLGALRGSLRRLPADRMPKDRLLAMKEDASIGEILESFEYGNLHDSARHQLPAACRELEVTTLGELAHHTRYEIAGPQSRFANNETLEYVDAVLKEFGLPELRYSRPMLDQAEMEFIRQHGLDDF